MRRVIAIWLALCGLLFAAHSFADDMTLLGVGTPKSGGTYIGPGNVVPGAVAEWGLRAYNATYAASNGNIADIVDTATGVATCTIKAKTNGDADLSSNLCVGNTLSVTTFCTVTHAAGCSITKLYDQSGGGNCSGACDAVQATLANMPALTLSCLNTTLPCMNFGATALLTPAGSLSSQAQPFTISHVANSPDNSGGHIVIGINTGIEVGYVLNGANDVGVYANGATSAVSPNGAPLQWHSVQATANNTSSAIYVDGTGTSPGVGAGTQAAAGTINIGKGPFGAFMVGKVAEIGLWDLDFSSSSFANASAMCHNQFTYWATVTSC